MFTMPNSRIARNAMCLALLVGASACAGAREPTYPIPDEPGIYAFTTKDNVRRLDGDREFEVESWPDRSRMPSNVHFVIYEPALAGRSAGNSVELWRVAWVRSEIDAQGQAMRIQGSEWAVAPIAPFAIPFRYESPPGETQIVHIVPTQPLQPGLYTLRIAGPGARQARIGVGWDRVDQRQYSAANCVDRYEGNAYRTCTVAVGAPTAALAAPVDPYAGSLTANAASGGLASLSAPEPVPAIVPTPAPAAAQLPAPAAQPALAPVAQPALVPVAQPALAPAAQPAPTPAAQPTVAAASGQGLQIALVDPVRRNDGLVIQGVVINTSNQVRAIPAMQGSLENQSGQEMRRWVFRPPVQSLRPGERANFKTEVRPVPAGVARASVAFIAGS